MLRASTTITSTRSAHTERTPARLSSVLLDDRFTVVDRSTLLVHSRVRALVQPAGQRTCVHALIANEKNRPAGSPTNERARWRYNYAVFLLLFWTDTLFTEINSTFR
jgi:hypothetical protein